ncbi:hypothetical protein DACRYDRAFT_23844 [Dacryopinax primogenitus]|uniref:Uncharacterized protein n=1 Tax=Dacryopinax primogenitus (strain DJM 731) TaxID=1858805 RepID=M5FQN5_DACPD|nr:uncharacterized protein DACRYDRAFT_23844 [Dacryopinax primogenitus]EJT99225.1 hypothetical protein DACRYDRAFT_23844 [Dacryopinax primogenitus]
MSYGAQTVMDDRSRREPLFSREVSGYDSLQSTVGQTDVQEGARPGAPSCQFIRQYDSLHNTEYGTHFWTAEPHPQPKNTKFDLHSTTAHAGHSATNAPSHPGQQHTTLPSGHLLNPMVFPGIDRITHDPLPPYTSQEPVSRLENWWRQGGPSNFNPTNHPYPAQPPFDGESRIGGVPRFLKEDRRLPPPIPSRPMGFLGPRATNDRYVLPPLPELHPVPESSRRYTTQQKSSSWNQRPSSSNAFYPPPVTAPVAAYNHRVHEVIDLTRDDDDAGPAQPRDPPASELRSLNAATTSCQRRKEGKVKGKPKSKPKQLEYTDLPSIQTGFACPYPSPDDPRQRCHVLFSSRDVLQRHLGGHLKEERAMLRLGGEGFDQNSLVFGGVFAPGFPCQLCDYPFWRKDSRDRHQKIDQITNAVSCPKLGNPKNHGNWEQRHEEKREKYGLPEREVLRNAPMREGEGSQVARSTNTQHPGDHPPANNVPRARYTWAGTQ